MYGGGKSRGKITQSGISLPGPHPGAMPGCKPEANRLPDLNHSAVLLLDFSSHDSLSIKRTISEHKGVCKCMWHQDSLGHRFNSAPN